MLDRYHEWYNLDGRYQKYDTQPTTTKINKVNKQDSIYYCELCASTIDTGRYRCSQCDMVVCEQCCRHAFDTILCAFCHDASTDNLNEMDAEVEVQLDDYGYAIG